MNRPKFEDYFYYRDGYEEDLEKYCDTLEERCNTLEERVGVLEECIKTDNDGMELERIAYEYKIEELEKALDKVIRNWVTKQIMPVPYSCASDDEICKYIKYKLLEGDKNEN